jgi:hypothetical protein
VDKNNPPPPGGMDVSIVSKGRKAKCRTVKTKKQERMKYKQSTTEYQKKNNVAEGVDALFVFVV